MTWSIVKMETQTNEQSQPETYHEEIKKYEEDSENLCDWVSLSYDTLQVEKLINFARSTK